MDETEMQNPIFRIANSNEKSNSINNDIKEKEINEYVIEKSDLINNMNLMNQMDMMNQGNQMNLNQMDPMVMNNSMNSQIGMNNQMNLNQMDMINSPMNSMMGQMDMNQNELNMKMFEFINSQMHKDNQFQSLAMMMNQMQNFNQLLDKEKINDKGIHEISLIFRSLRQYTFLKCPVMIQCLPNERVSDVIQRYIAKSGDNDPTKKFIYNSKALNQNLTVAEAGLTNNGNIFVVSTKAIRAGGIPLMFTDLSKNKTKEIGLSKKAPSYKKVTKGINIFGICNFKKCKAYKKVVVVKIKKKKIDLIKERDKLFCPECEAIIIPKTVGFYLCKFKIYGKKYVDNQVERFENEMDEANKKDSLKYFDPELNGEVTVIELIFEVLEYL